MDKTDDEKLKEMFEQISNLEMRLREMDRLWRGRSWFLTARHSIRYYFSHLL